MVILAGEEEDEKSSFKAVIMDQIEKLKKQLDKPSANRHVLGRPLPAVDQTEPGRDYRQALHSIAALDRQAPGGRTFANPALVADAAIGQTDYRQALHSIAAFDRQAPGGRTFTNRYSSVADGNRDSSAARRQEAESRFRSLFEQMNLQNGPTAQRYLY